MDFEQIYEMCLFFQLKGAKSVVIIGGGASGVEQAAEVAHYYPDKHITIIHAKDHLINDQVNDKFLKWLNSVLENYKIKVILGKLKFFFFSTLCYNEI